MDKEKQNKIKDLYNKYIAIKDISVQTNTDLQDIKNFIQTQELKRQRDDYYKNLLNAFVNKNFTRTEIAEATNLSPKKISYLCNKYKIDKSFRTIKKQVMDDRVITEYNNNAISITEMAKKMNLSYSCIKYIYKRNGLKNIHGIRNKKYTKLDEEKYQAILYELKNTNVSLEKIAKKYNITRQRIYQIQKTNKIKR